MIPELETERTRLRPARLEDAEQAQKLFPQWEIVKISQSRRHFLVTARRFWRKSVKKLHHSFVRCIQTRRWGVGIPL